MELNPFVSEMERRELLGEDESNSESELEEDLDIAEPAAKKAILPKRRDTQVPQLGIQQTNEKRSSEEGTGQAPHSCL